jgi:phage protein U
MYAVLGDIQFDLITYFDGFDSTFAAEYAEHSVIEGKPRLQYTGAALDEVRIRMAFHQAFCDPETELARLKDALASHGAMALVLGNGDYKGWFVLTEVSARAEQTNKTGTLVAAEVNVTLREFVGDPANPLPPPAVLTEPETPPAQAVTKVATSPAAVSATASLQENIASAVSQATQATGALRLAADVVRMAQRLRDNPLAALGRVPGLLGSLGDVLEPLQGVPASLSRLRDLLPDAARVIRAGNTALGEMQGAQDSLSGLASAANVVGKIDGVAGAVSAAQDAMETVSRGIGRLAGKVVTRSA